MSKTNEMRDDIQKTLLGLALLTVLTLMLGLMGKGFQTAFFKPMESNYVVDQVEVERPEDIERVLDLSMEPITAEEFERFKEFNGLQ
jgi:hypothetical protein